MKIYLWLLGACFVAANEPQNSDLREENKILKDRLRVLYKSAFSVTDDYFYNKAKLAAFVNTYFDDSDFYVKFALLEAMQYYLECIIEDFELDGEHEGVSIKELKDIAGTLRQQVASHRQFVFSKDLSDQYNSLKASFEEKQVKLFKSQEENSDLIAKLGKTQAEIEDFQIKSEQIADKIEKLSKELEDNKFTYTYHLENFKKTMQMDEITSIAKENGAYSEIQNSQDMVILSLQVQSEDQTLTLEQISVENQELSGKISLLQNNINRLERDLSTKSAELLKSENKFEGFRSAIEQNTKDDLEKLRKSEQMYLEDIDKLDSELESLESNLQVCVGKVEIGQLNKRKIHTKINELEEELQETCMRVESTKESKQKEIDFINQKILDTALEIRELEMQKQKVDEKISEQQKVVDKYNTQLSEAEYQSKRRPID